MRAVRPVVGLIPAMPQKCAGRRMLPPSVASRAERRQTGGDGRRLAAAAAAGRAREVVRIVGPTVDEVVALERERYLRHVRLAEHDRARRLEARHAGRVLLRHEPRAPLRPADRHDARHVERVLDRHRHAVQRPRQLAARERRVQLPRAPARRFACDLHERVQLRVDLLDARQIRARHFLRGDFPLADGPRDLARGRVDDLVHDSPPSC